VKKIKFVGLVMVMAFVLMGVAFAAGWTDSVVANATVNTGDLSIAFDGTPWLPQDSDIGPDPVTPPLNVANTTCSYSSDKKELTITISNAYPGYHSTVYYDIMNTGSIPVKLGEPVIQNASPDALSIQADSLNGVTLLSGGLLSVSRTVGITTTVLDTAAQDHDYTFTVTIPAGQFNK
jgi:hypothetical protein